MASSNHPHHTKEQTLVFWGMLLSVVASWAEARERFATLPALARKFFHPSLDDLRERQAQDSEHLSLLDAIIDRVFTEAHYALPYWILVNDVRHFQAEETDHLAEPIQSMMADMVCQLSDDKAQDYFRAELLLTTWPGTWGRAYGDSINGNIVICHCQACHADSQA